MSKSLQTAFERQQAINSALLSASVYMKDKVTSKALPLRLDLSQPSLKSNQIETLKALQIEAARIAITSVSSLATLKEVDHLGGGLDMLPALLMTLGLVDYEAVDFTIENAHTSIGYYSALAALGFLDPNVVIDTFRRGIDIPGHVSTVPGGTQLNGGRLGVMIPAAVGMALGKKAWHGDKGWVICHCGDAGWIAGHALNGFNAADYHHAPVTFIMHRNGIQLSGSNQQVFDKDPRPMIAAMGVEIIEVASIHDEQAMFKALKKARALARKGRPNMIYPVGYGCAGAQKVDLTWLGKKYGILNEVKAFAAKNSVKMNTPIWVPGALMSYRDVECMLECVFLVNRLPGGKGHHDGHMQGRDLNAVLANPMLQFTPEQTKALKTLRKAKPRTVVSQARPRPGSTNLVLTNEMIKAVELPGVGKVTSARAGVQVAYELIAKHFTKNMFVIDCDLAPSTKLDKARKILARDHQFELSIEEQIATLMGNGLAVATHKPQFTVFATFAAFFEGIAREGFDMWRYQRNLNGINEGLNVTYHLSHVGSCTGRDHFSGWSFDWINIARTYLPYLDRMYAPADARAAFVAIRDAAARYGAHMVCIPRDNLPILAKQDGSGPLWNAETPWEPVTAARIFTGARKAILAVGATAFVAIQAAEELAAQGRPTDVYVINGLPVMPDSFAKWASMYSGGLVTVEDGIIGNPAMGLQGFAGLVATHMNASMPLAHLGIADPRVAPAEGHMELWQYFGIAQTDIVSAVNGL